MPVEEIGQFSVSHMRVLDEAGNVDQELEPQLGEEDLIKLYRAMVLAREGDQRMLNLQRQGRIGTFGPCTGHEAVSCAAAFAMTEKDWFVGAFRELGGRLMRGDPLSNCMLFHNGYEEGSVLPEPGRTLPISIIVGSQALHAVGIAYAMKYRKETDSAVVTFFGDGASSQGYIHEACNFAGVWKAPVVFICQNNQWAISVPFKKQSSSKTISQRAIAYDMPTIQVDGNDALAVYRAVKEALDRAHAGEGPSFIEAVTYRLIMHTTADDPKKYRSEEEAEIWWKKEPLLRFKKYLENKGFWNEEKQARLYEEIKKEVDGAVEALESKTDFKPEACFDHVFGTKHEDIEEQRAAFMEELGKEAADA